MALSRPVILTFFVAFFAVFLMVSTDFGDSAYRTGACIRNCAYCKKMFGPVFASGMCVETCYKTKGKFIPDCQSQDSIQQFVTGYDDD